MVKKKILFAIMILFCISIITSENKSGIGKTEETVLNSIMDFIGKRNYSDARIKKFMSNNGKDSLEEEMLGFGLKKFSNNLRHENMLFQIDYISYKNNPCKLVIRLAEYEYKEGEKNLDEKSIKSFKKFFTKEATIYPPFIYIDEAGNMIQQERNEYRFVCEFPEGYRKYSTYKEKLVGPCVEMNLPEDLQKYYDFLYSAEEDTEYGYYEGIAGVKPMGRIALIELLELNDVNVFINLLCYSSCLFCT